MLVGRASRGAATNSCNKCAARKSKAAQNFSNVVLLRHMIVVAVQEELIVGLNEILFVVIERLDVKVGEAARRAAQPAGGSKGWQVRWTGGGVSPV